MSGDERGGAGGRPFRTDGGQGPETLTDLTGIGSSRAEKLRDAGFETVADLRAASQAELAEVLGSSLAGRVKSQVEDGTPTDGPDAANGGESEETDQPSVPSQTESTDKTADAEESDDIGWEPDDGTAEEASDQPSVPGRGGDSDGQPTEADQPSVPSRTEATDETTDATESDDVGREPDDQPTVPGSSTETDDTQAADATGASSAGATVEQERSGDSVETTVEREGGSSEDSILAALVSFFIPGIGNMINGDTDRGLVIFVVWVIWLVVVWGIDFFIVGSIITVITLGFGIIIQGLLGLVLGLIELVVHIIAAIDAYRRSEIVDNVTVKVDQVRN